jgi:hypothetical protein
MDNNTCQNAHGSGKPKQHLPVWQQHPANESPSSNITPPFAMHQSKAYPNTHLAAGVWMTS